MDLRKLVGTGDSVEVACPHCRKRVNLDQRLLETAGAIACDNLPLRLRRPKSESDPEADAALRTLEEVERAYVKMILDKTGGNKAKAARILGINRTSLWRMMQRWKHKQ